MRKRILAIDDDPDILDIYTLILEAEGYSVLTLLSPENINTAVTDFAPDLILLDIRLGNVNGLDICKELKSEPLAREIPVFIVSADESAKGALSVCYANGFLIKPFNLHALTNRISDCLDRKVMPIKKGTSYITEDTLQ